MSTTKEQVKAATSILVAVAGTIRELHRVPCGHLYAQLMGKLTLGQYQGMIDVLKRAGMVREEQSHELVWIGK